jgi:hypothetical protein
VDNETACGRPFQDAAALLVDPEDEPDVPEVDDDESEEDDDDEDVDDEEEDDSLFADPEPLSFALLSFAPEDAFALSRLSFR